MAEDTSTVFMWLGKTTDVVWDRCGPHATEFYVLWNGYLIREEVEPYGYSQNQCPVCATPIVSKTWGINRPLPTIPLAEVPEDDSQIRLEAQPAPQSTARHLKQPKRPRRRRKAASTGHNTDHLWPAKTLFDSTPGDE